ncbi:TrlF family AAA-like ATPase [Glycomyces artemisiae]|uniref:Uncharacterized protein n=1 Tax=Glycomyces artemisiae TaxID=1076443 RepID=A0A2T0UDK6_9ACTN|nr:hypothetical protein B0I28_111126 [Glycomyces artemisiae]
MMGQVSEQQRGTDWGIWDLHVHTPASIVQQYGGNTDEVWDRYIAELGRVPEEIKVIGINDYWFLDGYRRVRAAFENGQLQNLEEVLPVIEMRLDQFGGTDGKLSRVNLHVIFDPELGADVIQAQFINAMQPRVKLSPEHDQLNWGGTITRDSLIDFGKKIKKSVPVAQLKNYGSDLKEGFNNLNVSLADVEKVLESPYFQNKALVGIGKTEWADIKWSDQSIAAKKNVVNKANFIFTAYSDTSRWEGDVKSLRSSEVNFRVLDCSDAHDFSDSPESMRLGACQTWLNTTPTFSGLSYALKEFDRRVYVGLEPPALARIRKNPERFITNIEIRSENPKHNLFDYSIPLNPGFVAVVGNKGQGKSALLDCIALAGNSSRIGEFAFLTPSRFLRPNNKKVAKEYYSEIRWETGAARRVRLHEEYDRSTPVSVEYLPQAFVERVCNIDPVGGEADEFERELRTVLFTHIREEDRAEEKNFDALLSQKAQASRAEIDRIRDSLRAVISMYTATTAFLAEHSLKEVEGRLTLREEELAEANTALKFDQAALAEIDASSVKNPELDILKARSEDVELKRAVLLSSRVENEQAQAKTRQALSRMNAIALQADALRSDAVDLAAEAQILMGEGSDRFLSFTVDSSVYLSWRDRIEEDLRATVAEHYRLDLEIEVLEAERRELAAEFVIADTARERARQRVLQSEERVASIIGTESDNDSLSSLEALRMQIVQAPGQLDELRELIISHSGRIHAVLQEQLDAVSSLYEPASRFISSSEVVQNAGLEFSADLRILPSWISLSGALDGRRNGSLPEWLDEMPQRVEGTNWSQLAGELSDALKRLEHERGGAESPFRDPASAIKSTVNIEDFLMSIFDLSWLEVRFGLTGDGLPLSQLSPGQRGLVLALFYLVVDRRTTPLILDQPEENLDNETIASKLVPAIYEAAGRRQTIVVTHNANLAVVGDADQIIHCKLNENRFTVKCGSISELNVAEFALNVLEGTKPAFDNRRLKYESFPEIR